MYPCPVSTKYNLLPLYLMKYGLINGLNVETIVSMDIPFTSLIIMDILVAFLIVVDILVIILIVVIPNMISIEFFWYIGIRMDTNCITTPNWSSFLLY